MEYCLCPEVMPVETVEPGAPALQAAAQRGFLMIMAGVVATKTPHADVLSLCSAAGDQLSTNELRGNKLDHLQCMTRQAF